MEYEEHWEILYQNPCSGHMPVAVHYLLTKYGSSNEKLHVLQSVWLSEQKLWDIRADEASVQTEITTFWQLKAR